MAVFKEICKTIAGYHDPRSHDCRRGWPHAEGCASTSTGWRLWRRGKGWLFFLVMGWDPLLQCHPIWSYGSHLLILQNKKTVKTQYHIKSNPPIKVTLELQRDPEETASGGISLSFSIGEIHYALSSTLSISMDTGLLCTVIHAQHFNY